MKTKKPSQKEIGLVLGVSQPTVSKYANGVLSLSWEQALLLKKAFNYNDNDINNFVKNNNKNKQEAKE